MKKKLIKVSTLLLVFAVLVAGMFGCVSAKTKLRQPQVIVGVNGMAVWAAVEDTLYYAYVVDDGTELVTGECRVQLSEGQTIRVKAVSAREGIADSDFSEPQTYRKSAVDPAHDHSDVNDDGICDLCEVTLRVDLSFYAVNDLHGKFMDTSGQPGVDEFTTYMKQLYADPAREEILLSSGDMWQGTVESSTTKGQLMTEWMNDLGFVSMTLGNHEYDWGSAVLEPNSELADFPFLAINVTENGTMPGYCKPSVVVERSGLKIGIIGAIGDCLSSISGEFQGGLSFAQGERLTSLVKAEAERLRKEEGCDFIVYSIHEGGSGYSSSGITKVTNSRISYYDTSLSDGYVDLVFEAHTHKSYILEDEYGVYHLQGGGENKGVSLAEVSFNTVTKEYTVAPRVLGKSIYAASSLDDDPVVEELFEKYFPDSDPYNTVLGENATEWDSSDIADKVAALYYEKGVEVWGAQYDIVLGGGYLKTRSPYDLARGSLTYADIFSVLPFDNAIVLGKIKGRDLKARFLVPKDNYHVYYPSYFDVSDSADYYIIIDSYTSTYRDNNITEVARLEEAIYARDLLAQYVSDGRRA